MKQTIQTNTQSKAPITSKKKKKKKISTLCGFEKVLLGAVDCFDVIELGLHWCECPARDGSQLIINDLQDCIAEAVVVDLDANEVASLQLGTQQASGDVLSCHTAFGLLRQ
jgi:hypothetical protein